MHGDETLGGTRRFEPLHLALASAERLVGDLGPVVPANPLFVVGAQANLLERSPVGAQLIGRHPGRGEALLPEQLTDELTGGGPVPPALDQDLQHLAFIIDGPSQVHLPSIDPHHHLILSANS